MARNGYWKQQELDHERKWSTLLSNSPLRWMTRDEFWLEFEKQYSPYQRHLEKELYYSARLPDLRSRIRESPVFTPLEEDFPGPVERWYGKCEQDLFLLTFHYYVPADTTTFIRAEDESQKYSRIDEAFRNLLKVNPYF